MSKSNRKRRRISGNRNLSLGFEILSSRHMLTTVADDASTGDIVDIGTNETCPSEDNGYGDCAYDDATYGGDAYGSDPYGSDPYGSDPYGSDPYGDGDPYGTIDNGTEDFTFSAQDLSGQVCPDRM